MLRTKPYAGKGLDILVAVYNALTEMPRVKRRNKTVFMAKNVKYNTNILYKSD